MAPPFKKNSPWRPSMLISSTELPEGTILDVDVCIIGAGPAAIAIADQLRSRRNQVAILESGGLEPGVEEAAIEFNSPHFEFPANMRQRQFGGMSAVWNTQVDDDGKMGARYLPLDPIDFERRSWIAHSGWPLSYEQLVPLYRRAQVVCGLGPFDFRSDTWSSPARRPLSSPREWLTTQVDQLGTAEPFISNAIVAFRADRQVCVYMGATAEELVADPNNASVTHSVRVRTANGRAITVRATLYVIAAGAIESARLMLVSRTGHPAGLGNSDDNVGRFFMDHPRVNLGFAHLLADSNDLGIFDQHVSNGQQIIGKLKLSEEILRSNQLLNGNMGIYPHYLSIRQHVGKNSLRSLTTPEWPNRSLRSAASTAVKAVTYGTSALASFGSVAVEQRRLRPAMSTVWSRDDGSARPHRSFKVIYQPEQVPDRSNRVTLSEQRDDSGQPIARLEWRWTDADLDSIRRARRLIADELWVGAVGRLPAWPDKLLPEGAYGRRPESAHHHLGTTRMSATETNGVVDPDCRVFGTRNVYVAGGSVFPTGGYANPTLTVIALSIRLADTLKKALGG